ncbi:MAG: hypothetical protein GWM90_18360, partial [Gemmatimonadetes bacterium]|nr:LPS-assembly protein LptD [Gemmatimonadota bacterium]NIQ56329.1 LPS-assembly protein LptD [Gemmatimonadota bacterium]NIU76519.1 hypothetical protein [Gammaproteobacteria bacterium]NIX45984.1 hypothetical protein [Gemmatimonadota bacterium]NIY10299.1 hypothetical protein [Gemmatimonadota bacterium]
ARPASPVQPDTAGADSLAVDSLAVDTLPAGLLPPAGDTTRREGQEPVVVRPPPGDTLVLFTESADTVDRMVVEDSVLAVLRSLEGYVATEYTGERAVFVSGTNELELSGESRIAREGSALETDSLLVYAGETGVVCGYGTPVLSGEAEPIESDQVCFDIDRDLGMARGARTEFQQGATWFVRGADNRVFVLTGGEHNTLYGEQTEFTSCDLEHPHYTFQARSLKMVEDEMMVARDVTLRFEDVPVFWLPWMVQSMKRGRRSGLLMPQFGVNDIVRNSTGYNRHLSNLGFYWAMNDYMSAKGTFEWYSGNWTAVEGALTYRWLRQFLQGNLTAKHYWRQQDGQPSSREFTLNTSNSWQPDERTRLQLNADYASSTDFVRRNSFDPQELNRRITSSASVNRSFDWGSMSLGADRQQQLSTEQVDYTLPSLSLTVSPMTLFSNGEGLDLTWSGRGQASRRTRDVQDTLPRVRDAESLSASASHSLTFGRLSLNQSADYDRDTQGAKPALAEGPDTVALAEETGVDMGWSTSLSYQQGLWTGTTLSPTFSVSGGLIRNARTREAIDTLGIGGRQDFVQEPLRLSTGASLSTALYGFWPGFAGFSRIRHKIAPSLSWRYSPRAETTTLQDAVFGVRNLREQNQITLSFSQTFEAKVAEDEAADTAAVDTARADGEPRRLPQAEKVMLLALNTGTSFVYDFVAAREDGRGFQTDRITNSIRSDLLRGLQLSMTHDLFEEGEAAEPAEGQEGDAPLPPRTFDPFLTNLNASFSIDSDFWLFRALGLSSGAAVPEPEEPVDDEPGEGAPVGAEADPERGAGGLGSVVPSRRDGGTAGRAGVGRWRAQLSYSLRRNRPGQGLADDASQMLQGSFSFDPTEKWSVSWRTAYSFTDGEFANHVLTLSRDLHRWQANFDFIKAQNGNFAMQFRVQLRDNPDLKLDYDQRTDPSERR